MTDFEPSAFEPSAALQTLRMRATLLAGIRSFFAERQVLEVETPLLARTTATDPHLQSMQVDAVQALRPSSQAASSSNSSNSSSSDQSSQNESNQDHPNAIDSELAPPWFLQTSPEFAMKRLLAVGSGAIFQLCKAFRQDEISKRHNPEFTLLEWYRPGFDEWQLMDELEQLMNSLFDIGQIKRLSYRELFKQTLQIDPHSVNITQLQSLCQQHINLNSDDYSRDDYLHLLLSHVVEPAMQGNYFVYNFPASQAALARIEPDDQGVKVARRFELFCSGMEIANGYFELCDAQEQRRRFQADNAMRRDMDLPEYPLDEKLIAALEHGLPDCAGVAVGVDRLLMLVSGLPDIAQVISFNGERI